MSETLLHIQQTLSILKKMTCSTMAEGVNRERMVETGLCQGILENGIDIAGFDGLRRNSSTMRLENKVVTGKSSPETLQYFELLFRNGHDTVFLSFALIDKNLLTVKILGLAKRQSRADVNPFEAVSLAYS